MGKTKAERMEELINATDSEDEFFRIPDDIKERPEVVRFEKNMDIKIEELSKVLEFLVESPECALEMHQAIQIKKSVKYFRGVDFHVNLLKHGKKVKDMIPTIIKDKSLEDVKTLDDTILLGQFMLYVGLITKSCKHPNLIVAKGSVDDKYPKYLADDLPIFEYGGYYLQVGEENKKQQTLGLGFIMVVVLVLLCFRLWPEWLQEYFYYAFVYGLIGYFATIPLRMTLWIISYHFGFEFWLFPQYFSSFTRPNKIFYPMYEVEKRSDFASPQAILFRAVTATFIITMIYLVVSDEKTMDDFQELQTGVSEMLEYGQEFVMGHQLTDGNKTETFSQKIEKEMSKTDEDDDVIVNDEL